MSSDGNNNNGALGIGPPPGHRRSSITQAALSNLFQRPPPTSANASVYSVNDAQRRRLSVTTIGLSGTSPTNPTPFGIRRGSQSTSSDSIDESAVEEEELPPGSIKTAPMMPFVRRMSFGSPAMRSYRPGGSPGNDQQVFNWSEQLRSRAESSVSGARPPYASSPPRGMAHYDRTKSVYDMPQPPAQASAVNSKPESRKPDAFQERILKGDFYMD